MGVLTQAHSASGASQDIPEAVLRHWETLDPDSPAIHLLEPWEARQLGRPTPLYRWWTPWDDSRRWKAGSLVWRPADRKSLARAARAALDAGPDDTEEVSAKPVRGIGYRTKRADGHCDRTGYEQLLVCSADASHRWRSIMPCRSGKCKTCHQNVKKRRGTRRAEKMAGCGMGFGVFTLPPDVTEATDWKSAVEIRRWVSRIVHQWLDYWYGYVPFKTGETRHRRHIEVGSYVALHPCGEHQHGVEEEHEKKGKEAFESPDWRPHYHAGYSLCLVDSETGELITISGFRTPQQLADLRWRWTSFVHQLRVQLGLSDWRDDYSSTQNVHLSYRSEHDKKRLLHRLSYDLRPFPDWYSGQNVPVSAYRVVGYGLASPNSRHAGQARTDDTEPTGWRAAVELTFEGEPRECRHEKCSGTLKVQGLPLRVGSEAWTLQMAPLLLYEDEDETAADSVFTRGRVEWICDDWCEEPGDYIGPLDLRL